MRPLTRVTPRLPPQSVKTYQVTAPVSTHWRPATCAEVDCAAWRHGWRTVVDERTDLGERQAAYIRSTCVPDALAASPAGRGRRRYVEHRDAHQVQDGTGPPAGVVAGLTVFEFPAGQVCFASGNEAHRVPLERQPLYLVRGGDWRGNPRGTPGRQHARPEDWVDDFATHQQQLDDTLRRG